MGAYRNIVKGTHVRFTPVYQKLDTIQPQHGQIILQRLAGASDSFFISRNRRIIKQLFHSYLSKENPACPRARGNSTGNVLKCICSAKACPADNPDIVHGKRFHDIMQVFFQQQGAKPFTAGNDQQIFSGTVDVL